jgi:hypothetical protein
LDVRLWIKRLSTFSIQEKVSYGTKKGLFAQYLCIQKGIFRREGKEEGNDDNVVRYKSCLNLYNNRNGIERNKTNDANNWSDFYSLLMLKVRREHCSCQQLKRRPDIHSNGGRQPTKERTLRDF